MEQPPFPHGAIPFAFSGLPAVRCLFTTAAAGDMTPVRKESAGRTGENRRRLMRAAGFPRWAELHQVHGDGLIEAEGEYEPDREEELAKADGHYTFERGMGLVIQTADCQPILIARSDGGAVAALHVGWRGNAMNFPGTAVERLCRRFACRPGDLFAVRGPSLGPAASEFVNFASEWPPEFLPWYDAESRTLNLWALTRHQLAQAGLRRERIYSLDLCTKTMAGALFSYRRQESERQVAVIWME